MPSAGAEVTSAKVAEVLHLALLTLDARPRLPHAVREEICPEESWGLTKVRMMFRGLTVFA